MNWTFFVRAAAAALLVACLFLPLSTCTNRGQTTVHVPIHDIKPMAEVLLVFCWPVPLLVAEALRPRLSTSGIVLVTLQPLLAAGTWYQITLYTLFETPAIGAQLATDALAVIFVAGVIELILRVKRKRAALRSAALPYSGV